MGIGVEPVRGKEAATRTPPAPPTSKNECALRGSHRGYVLWGN